MKQTITAVIPAKNEENNIKRCLNSLLWCDKIVVMWMGNDKTAEIARKMGADVITMNSSDQSDFIGVQENTNWAIDHCKTDWILRVDADEEVSKELKEEIQSLLNSKSDTEIVAYGIPRKHYILGAFLRGGDWSYDRLVRLFKPQFARYDPIVHVHEQFKINGQIEYLKQPLLHYSHPTIAIALQKFNIYTDVEVHDMHQNFLTAILNLIIQPPYIFLRWMIWHKGYQDGWRGIVAGGLRAYYDILLYTKYIKKLLNKSL